MTDYQKYRLNSMMRTEWESYQKHFSLNGDAHRDRANEAFGWTNGMRETLEILGYSIKYVDGAPQII